MRPTVLTLYHRANTFGGSFNSVLDVLRNADRGRFRLVAMVPGPGNCSDQFREMGLDVIHRPEHPGARTVGYLSAVASFALLLRRQRIDLVYVSDYVTWRSAELAAARLAGIPRVVHVRAPRTGTHVDPELLRATVVVGNSKATLSGLRGLVPDRRLRVVYNFVDLDRFAHGRDIRHEFFDDHPTVVGFVGVFRPEKGIEYFLEAVRLVHARAPHVRFLAVGGESTVEDVGWLDRMKRLAAELGIADVVRFTGSRDDIPDVMHSIDVIVVPSLNEGFGRVIAEAAAAGVPAVGANAAGIPEVVQDGVTGRLVPPRDGAAIAAAVLDLLDDEGWRRRLGEAARAGARERFAPATQIAELQDAWTEALRARARVRPGR